MEARQTIKVTIPAAFDAEKGMKFRIDGKSIAEVTPDPFNRGKFRGNFGVLATCDNETLPDAVEFISGCIERHFAGFNIGVEFKDE